MVLSGQMGLCLLFHSPLLRVFSVFEETFQALLNMKIIRSITNEKSAENQRNPLTDQQELNLLHGTVERAVLKKTIGGDNHHYGGFRIVNSSSFQKPFSSYQDKWLRISLYQAKDEKVLLHSNVRSLPLFTYRKKLRLRLTLDNSFLRSRNSVTIV